MNKVVREHYPVEKLPADLRADLGLARTVTVTIETEERPAEVACTRSALRRARELVRAGRIAPVTAQEAVSRVRALRDEWPA